VSIFRLLLTTIPANRSVLALFGIAAAQYGYPMLDPLAGMLVAAYILKIAYVANYALSHDLDLTPVPVCRYGITMESIHELTDRVTPLDRDNADKVVALLSNVEGLYDAHRFASGSCSKLSSPGLLISSHLSVSIRTRKMGHYTLLDLHIRVDPMISVSSAHNVAEYARASLLQHFKNVTEVLVHVDPEDDKQDADHEDLVYVCSLGSLLFWLSLRVCCVPAAVKLTSYGFR
jgi:divalent metal cation (Fe/Co/Zn/Cd) transporter